MGTNLAAEGSLVALNPADGSEVGRVAATTPDEVRDAVGRARAAQANWAQLGYSHRGRLLANVRDRFLEQARDIAKLLHQENGKPELEAYFSEVVPNIDLFDFHVAQDHKLLRDEPVNLSPLNYPGKKGVIEHRPLGVIGLISPWNFPVSIPLRTLIPALMAGNAVVFKPSEYAVLTGKFLGELFNEFLPPGILTVVQGDGAIGAALVEARTDRIVFTGSVATGRRVNVAAAEHLIPVSLELGGKDAAIVLEDADLDRAANGIVWGAFANAGQNCASIERCYVVKDVADAFIAKVVQRTQALRLTSEGGTAEVGPLINAAQLATVERHVQEAVGQGARILAGGKARTPGHFFEATVLVDVDHRMNVMREETFGPLLPIQVVANPDEAIRLANDSDYGLSASLWSRSVERANSLAPRLETGIVTINNHGFTAAIPQAPWTGVKHTGSGVTNSKAALLEYTRPHFTLVDKSKETLEVWWYPYTATLEKVVDGVLQMSRRSLGAKIGAARKLLPLMKKRLQEG